MKKITTPFVGFVLNLGEKKKIPPFFFFLIPSSERLRKREEKFKQKKCEVIFFIYCL